MIGNSFKNLEKIKKLFDENYTYFLKNILVQAYKIKNQYELKSIKKLKNNQYQTSLNTPIKDIFNYQSKKLSLENIIDNSIKDSDIKKLPSTFYLDENKYLENQSKISNNIIKLNNSSEENPNLLFRICNPKDEKLEVKIIKNAKNDKETFLQLWSTSNLINTIKLEEKGIKLIYLDDVFGKPKFSPDGKKLIFIVELDNSKNYKNYFSIENKINLTNGINEENDEYIKNMKKFEYRQEFGEALEGKADPFIAIYDIIKSDIGLIDLNELNVDSKNDDISNIKIYPSTPFFDSNNNDIIFTGYNFKNDNKLGLIYCLKRPSKIYLLRRPKINWKNIENKDRENKESGKTIKNEFNFDNKLFVLSNEIICNEGTKEMIKSDIIFKDPKYNYTNIFPLISPEGKNLLYLSNEKATPHMNGFRLNLINWEKEKIRLDNILSNNKELKEKYNKNDIMKIVQIPNFYFETNLLVDKISFENKYFTGIYSYEDTLSKSLFISNDKIILNSINENSNIFYIYDITKNLLIKPYQKISLCVFDSKKIENSENNINNDKVFFSVNSYVNVLPFVCMWKINIENYNNIINKIIQEENKNNDKNINDSILIDKNNYRNFLDKNNNPNNFQKEINNKIINLETENYSITKEKLSVLYLGEENTNEIFEVIQIESENSDYFSENEDKEFPYSLNLEVLSKVDFNTHNNEEISNKNKNDSVDDNLNKAKEDFMLQNDFKKYLNHIILNTIVEDYYYNDTYGHFIYSDSEIYSFKNSNLNNNSIEKRPLVYFIHGGPNSNLTKKFLNIQSLFLAHGYGILVVNYPGSSGFGQNYLNSLNGKIGSLDVESCGEFLLNFLNERKEKFNIDENNTIIYGGSHGGFLGAWLICNKKYKHLFSSAVLRNPVTDLNSNFACSDIPDWVIGQSIDYDIENNFPPSKSTYEFFYEKSPLYQAHNAITPTLIKLGKVDKRVNYFNGLYFYQALKQYNCKTKLHLYPDDSHPLASDETDIDGNFTDLVWMRSNLKKFKN